MSDRDAIASCHQGGDAEHLGSLVERYQDALNGQQRAQEMKRVVAAREEQQVVLEQLYLTLEPDLRKLAGGWIRSMQFQQIAATNEFSAAFEALTLSAFGAIVEALPTLKVDPARNVRGLLITIARNDLYDQEYKVYHPGLHQRVEPDAPLVSGDRDSAMWQPSSGEILTPAETKDTASTDFEEVIISRDRLQHVWPIVEEFWHRTLPPEDLWLIRMRWFHDPPVPFKDIARHLGAGWTEAAVKERHYRILKRTREYLKEQGLLDADDTGR